MNQFFLLKETMSTPSGIQQTYERIKAILSEARAGLPRHQYGDGGGLLGNWAGHCRAGTAGQQRAEYGQALIAELSSRLKSEFGKGFDPSNLAKMRAFYLAYPILDALRPELSWTHYRLLLRVEKPEARAFYEAEAVNSRWSTRELERQIHSLLFERLALSRDREGVLALAEKGHEIQQPSDLIKDPYVLEFTGLPQSRAIPRIGP